MSAQPARVIIPADGDAERWQRPLAHGPSRMEILRRRHVIKRAVRDYLDAEGFIEMDMPLLVQGTTPDVEIESFMVEDRYLVTSTEYQIKRMEIGGIPRLYTLTQNYRRGDRGRYRNPEFTMLEWARVGGTLAEIERDAENYTQAAHRALGGTGTVTYQGHVVDLTGPWEALSVVEAVRKYANADLPDFTAASFAAALEQAGLKVKDDWRDDAVFLFTVLLDHVQTFLGFGKPVWLRDWPNFLTSSAKHHESNAFTERSELFIAGVEVADGFPSLTDAQRQRDNFASQLARRAHEGKAAVEVDQKYLSAMEEGFPAGAGMALGFDRLVMVLTDCADIASVLAFNWDEL